MLGYNSLDRTWVTDNGSLKEGYTPCLLKFGHTKQAEYPNTTIEYCYYKMAVKAGINMMPCCLHAIEAIPHFLTQRFDRIGNQKVHTQTLAAMAPLVKSYEGIFEVIRHLNLPFEDTIQQYLRTVFNVVTRNVDDHNKNFSFCMNQQGTWRLSHAYDLTFSVDLGAPAYANRHQLTLNEKDEDINRADLEKLAIENDIPDYKTLINQVMEAVSQFPAYAKEQGIPDDLIHSIQSEFIML